jgi:hypothetical protein
MAISRMHPIANWVRLAPHEHRRALDKVLQFRDAAPDPTASGLPEAAVAWFWSTQLPALVNDPKIRDQVLSRLGDLAAKQQAIDRQVQQQAGALLAQQAEIAAELALLEQVLP